jgi:LmbE family N-acetylglucosaminyl deacetylase
MPEKIVLAIVPHPDDAEFYAGGLLAKLVSEGAAVKILIATDGRCGTYRNSPTEIVEIRKKEALEAGKVFNAEVEMLGYKDYELNAVTPLELREKLVRTIREYQPNIVITQDAYARNEVHPDHRTLAWAASDAINFSQLPNIFSEQKSQKLEPHFAKARIRLTRLIAST